MCNMIGVGLLSEMPPCTCHSPTACAPLPLGQFKDCWASLDPFIKRTPTWNLKLKLDTEASIHINLSQFLKGQHTGLKLQADKWNDVRFRGQRYAVRDAKGMDPLPLGTVPYSKVNDRTWSKGLNTLSMYAGFVVDGCGMPDFRMEYFCDMEMVYKWMKVLVGQPYSGSTIYNHLLYASEFVAVMLGMCEVEDEGRLILQSSISQLKVWASYYHSTTGVHDFYIVNVKEKYEEIVFPLEADRIMYEADRFSEYLRAGSLEFVSKAGDAIFLQNHLKPGGVFLGWDQVVKAGPHCVAHHLMFEVHDLLCSDALGEGHMHLSEAALFALMYGSNPAMRLEALHEMKVGKVLEEGGGNCIFVEDGCIHIMLPSGKRTNSLLGSVREQRVADLLGHKYYAVEHIIPLDSLHGQVHLKFLESGLVNVGDKYVVRKTGKAVGEKGWAAYYESIQVRTINELSGWSEEKKAVAKIILPTTSVQIRHVWASMVRSWGLSLEEEARMAGLMSTSWKTMHNKYCKLKVPLVYKDVVAAWKAVGFA